MGSSVRYATQTRRKSSDVTFRSNDCGTPSYPGRSAALPSAMIVERRPEGAAEVSRGHSSRFAPGGEGPNIRSRTGAQRSRCQGDADKTAERPEQSPRVGDGITEGKVTERQRQTAPRDSPGPSVRATCWHPFVPYEPPYTEPYVRWCGRRGAARLPSYPLFLHPPIAPKNIPVSHNPHPVSSVLPIRNI